MGTGTKALACAEGRGDEPDLQLMLGCAETSRWEANAGVGAETWGENTKLLTC